jgi:GT2 family glycosyltransferase
MLETEATAPRVAIVIPTWNRKADVVHCLASLERLAYRNRFTVVVDNGSGDGTVAAVRARHPQVEVIENGVNLGYAGGNNVGIRWALGEGAEFVCLINNDTEVPPDLISELVRVARDDRQIAAVGGRNLLMEDPTRLWGAYGVLTYGPFVVRTEGRAQADGDEWRVSKDVDWVIGNGVLLTHEALQTVGLFDEEFFAYHEDVDWCLRARRAGFRIVYAGTAAILHKGGGSSDPQQPQAFPQSYFLGRNGIRLVRKHACASDRARFAVLCGLALTARWVRAVALRYCPSNRLRARGRAYTSWESAYRRGILDALYGRVIPFSTIPPVDSSVA